MGAYKLTVGGVIRTADGAFIPEDFGNRDWHAYQAWIDAGNNPEPAQTVADIKATALATIDQFHAATVQKLVGSPTQVEKDTWSLKLDAATAIINKTTVSAAGQAFLGGAGMTTDAAKAAWAASVVAKSAAYAQVVGLAEKLRDTARTAVKAAPDEVSLNAALDAQRAAADAAVASLMPAG